MQKSFLTTKKVALAAMFLALDVLARVLSAKTALLQISLTFVPTSMCAMTLGPMYAAVSAFFWGFFRICLKADGFVFPGAWHFGGALRNMLQSLFISPQ